MLKYWMNTNTHLNTVMKATQYLRSVTPVRRVLQRCVMRWRQLRHRPWPLGQELTVGGWLVGTASGTAAGSVELFSEFEWRP